MLGLERTAFAERKRRNSLPYKELVIYCEHRKMNVHYLLTGEGDDFNRELRKIPLELRNEQLYKIGKWLDVFWEKATEDERTWFYIELQKTFPEFKDWLGKEERNLENSFNRLFKKGGGIR